MQFVHAEYRSRSVFSVHISFQGKNIPHENSCEYSITWFGNHNKIMNYTNKHLTSFLCKDLICSPVLPVSKTSEKKLASNKLNWGEKTQQKYQILLSVARHHVMCRYCNETSLKTDADICPNEHKNLIKIKRWASYYNSLVQVAQNAIQVVDITLFGPLTFNFFSQHHSLWLCFSR